MRNCKKHLLSLNPKFNYRPPQLCETPKRNSRQAETTELGEFVKNAVETSTPGVNRKLPVQEMEKDNDAIPTANRPKRWRLSGFTLYYIVAGQRLRIRRKLAELTKAIRRNDVFNDVMEFADTYFNPHGKSTGDTLIATLTRKDRELNDPAP
ncbi:hypothetical protein GQX74_005904 [Glossina fuscipes]|nr:hypothetical protein GQX74_005904 [Glossina fuscipes]